MTRGAVRFTKPAPVPGAAMRYWALVNGERVDGTYSEVSKLYEAGKREDNRLRCAEHNAKRREARKGKQA